MASGRRCPLCRTILTHLLWLCKAEWMLSLLAWKKVHFVKNHKFKNKTTSFSGWLFGNIPSLISTIHRPWGSDSKLSTEPKSRSKGWMWASVPKVLATWEGKLMLNIPVVSGGEGAQRTKKKCYFPLGTRWHGQVIPSQGRTRGQDHIRPITNPIYFGAQGTNAIHCCCRIITRDNSIWCSLFTRYGEQLMAKNLEESVAPPQEKEMNSPQSLWKAALPVAGFLSSETHFDSDLQNCNKCGLF